MGLFFALFGALAIAVESWIATSGPSEPAMPVWGRVVLPAVIVAGGYLRFSAPARYGWCGIGVIAACWWNRYSVGALGRWTSVVVFVAALFLVWLGGRVQPRTDPAILRALVKSAAVVSIILLVVYFVVLIQ